MKINFAKYFAFFLLSISLIASCTKNEVGSLGDRGTSRIKILQSPTNNLFFAPFLTVDTFDLFSLRRDEVSNASLNESLSVVVMSDTAAITAYNDENGTYYEALPDSLYTIVTDGISGSGNVFTINLASGESGKEFTIAMDGSKWDVTHKYAIDFIITDSAGRAISEDKKEVFITIEAKNKWDGVYEITGTYQDFVFPAFTAIYPLTWELQTTGPTQCVVVDNYYLGIPGYIFSVDGTPDNLSYYGSFGLIINFDPETDEISSIENYYGQPSANTRSAFLDPTGVNAYDPATQTISIKYYMTQPSAVPDAPNIRATWDETWKYVGPRG